MMLPRRFPGQAVLILGMGRCGTSYLASFLRANGVDLGSNLGHSDYINPRGFYEHRSIVDFHRRLLARSDPGGVDIPLLASPAIAVTEQDSDDAVRILNGLSRSGLWGWKDPRTLLFIDLWLKLLPDAKLIVPIRHPLEVYYSYLKRIRVPHALRPSAVFFPAYARQSQRLLEVAQRHSPRVYVLDAQTAFRQPERLWTELAGFLEVEKRTSTVSPAFHLEEFTRLPLSERACSVFAKHFPEVAVAFERLNQMARIRFEPVPGSLLFDSLLMTAGGLFSTWRAVRARLGRV